MYFATLFILLLYSLFNYNDTFVVKKYFSALNVYTLFIIIIYIFMFVSLRKDCGFDYSGYKNEFKFLKENGLTANKLFEPFFLLLVYLSPTYEFLICLVFSISFFLKVYIIKNNSNNLALSLFIYCCSFLILKEMGQIRQGLALAFFLCGYFSKTKKGRVFFYILMISSHYSSFIVLLFSPYLFYFGKKKFHLFMYVVIILLSFLFSLFIKNILILFLEFFHLGIFTNKLHYYLSSSQISFSFSLFISRLMILFLALYYLAKSEYIYLINTYFISIVVQISFMYIPQIAGICSIYFSVFDCLLIPRIIKIEKKFSCKLLLFVFISLLYIFSYISLFSAELLPQLIPYDNFLFGVL